MNYPNQIEAALKLFSLHEKWGEELLKENESYKEEMLSPEYQEESRNRIIQSLEEDEFDEERLDKYFAIRKDILTKRLGRHDFLYSETSFNFYSSFLNDLYTDIQNSKLKEVDPEWKPATRFIKQVIKRGKR